MIYKLLDSADGAKSLEISITTSSEVEFTITEILQHSTEFNNVSITKESLYTLIGALHTIQKKLN